VSPTVTQVHFTSAIVLDREHRSICRDCVTHCHSSSLHECYSTGQRTPQHLPWLCHPLSLKFTSRVLQYWTENTAAFAMTVSPTVTQVHFTSATVLDREHRSICHDCVTHCHLVHFTSAIVPSQLHALSSAVSNNSKSPSNFANGEVSPLWFKLCRELIWQGPIRVTLPFHPYLTVLTFINMVHTGLYWT